VVVAGVVVQTAQTEHYREYENNQNKIKCNICNIFYSKIYMSRHLQSLKHIENEYEYKLEEDIETQLIGNGESEDDEN
jgi:capsular polysaccharide biosynthesis protein